ncbi:nuoD2 [Acrasis kona]|uniref:NuoD2 n=1 Tax=Acrasis kona TaxID=1008807 RepID=A0AAW2ZRE2_9EUKA
MADCHLHSTLVTPSLKILVTLDENDPRRANESKEIQTNPTRVPRPQSGLEEEDIKKWPRHIRPYMVPLGIFRGTSTVIPITIDSMLHFYDLLEYGKVPGEEDFDLHYTIKKCMDYHSKYGILSHSELLQTVPSTAWIISELDRVGFDFDSNEQVKLPYWDEKPAYDLSATYRGHIVFLFELKPDTVAWDPCYSYYDRLDVVRVTVGTYLALSDYVYTSKSLYNTCRMGVVMAAHHLLIVIMDHIPKVSDNTVSLGKFVVDYVSCDVRIPCGAALAASTLRRYLDYIKESLDNDGASAELKKSDRILRHSVCFFFIDDLEKCQA